MQSRNPAARPAHENRHSARCNMQEHHISTSYHFGLLYQRCCVERGVKSSNPRAVEGVADRLADEQEPALHVAEILADGAKALAQHVRHSAILAC